MISGYFKRNLKFCKREIVNLNKVYFADGGAEVAPPAGDDKEAVPFNLAMSEAARKRAASTSSAIAQVKKDESAYITSNQVILDLIAELEKFGFTVPKDKDFKSIDEVVDYMLANTDMKFLPLTLGDIHIDADATKKLRDLKIEFIFDEKSQKIEFKVPPSVKFFDAKGRAVQFMTESDATHFVDIAITFDEAANTFTILIGLDDGNQLTRFLKCE